MAYREYRNYDSNGERRRVKYNLVERIGVLSTKDTGWTREVNIVAWNDGEAKVDIREWSPGRERMSKGVTLPYDDAERLVRLLAKRYGIRLDDRPQAPGIEMPQATEGMRLQTAGEAMPPADTDTVPFGFDESNDANRQGSSSAFESGTGAMAVAEKFGADDVEKTGSERAAEQWSDSGGSGESSDQESD